MGTLYTVNVDLSTSLLKKEEKTLAKSEEIRYTILDIKAAPAGGLSGALIDERV